MFKTARFVTVFLVCLLAGANADDLYRVTVKDQGQARALSAIAADPILRLKNGYLILVDGRTSDRLIHSGLDFDLVASGISREELAVDNRLDRANVGRFPLIFEEDNLRVFRTDLSRLAPGERAVELAPLGQAEIDIDYPQQRCLDMQAATAGVDLDSLIGLIERDSLVAYTERLQAYFRRLVGTDSMYAAIDWTAAKFQSFGYDSVYTDEFWTSIWGTPTLLKNVVATKVGTIYPNRYVIVGAHLDGVEDSPAADDNGSGSAGVLEIARALKDIETYCTFIFITFDGEEEGLIGAWHYANNAATTGDSILYMLNLDMIAHYENATEAKLYYGMDDTYSKLWQELAGPLVGLTATLAGSSGGSDHYPFAQNGYQVTFVHEYIFSSVYHSPHDSTSYMDFGYMTRVVKASLATVYTVMQQEAAPRLIFTYPDGVPEFVVAGAETTFTATITGENTAVPVSGSGRLHYSINGLPYVEMALTELKANQYEVVLPVIACSQSLEFYLSAEEAQTGIHYDGSAEDPYSPRGVTEIVTIFADDFESDQGWTTENVAASGEWQRGVPVNDPNWDYDPESDADGSGQCYLTQNEIGDTDVDDGFVRLISPLFDMSQGGEIWYDYYLCLTDDALGWDRLLVEMNDAGGAGDWEQVVLHNTNGANLWRRQLITEAEIAAAGLTLSSQMVLRFTAMDVVPESIVEAGVDHLAVIAVSCDAEAPEMPTLLLPTAGTSTDDVTPEFVWTPTAGPGGSYTLQYSQNQTFAIDVFSVSDLSDTSYTPAAGSELTEGLWYWHVQAVDAANMPSGYQPEPWSFTVYTWTCGDCDGNEIVNVSDAVYLIAYIFSGGPAPDPIQSGDVDCNGITNVSDAVYILSFIFAGGPLPCFNCP